jgi:hypothetical protein
LCKRWPKGFRKRISIKKLITLKSGAAPGG